MDRLRPRVSVLLATSLTTLFPLCAGCSGAAEQPILNQFFTASRLRDNTTLDGFSMVALDPQKQGTVTSFSITNVTPEERKALTLKSLAKAHDDAKAEDDALNARRATFQKENDEAVQRIVKAGRTAKLKGADADVQASWFKMLDEGIELSRKVADARRKLAIESAVVKTSVADPRNPIDVSKYEGELVSKDVTVNATLRQPNGRTGPHTFLITMQRAILKGEKGDITGRWVITSVRDAAAPAGTKSS
jgi:hypothetical protein